MVGLWCHNSKQHVAGIPWRTTTVTNQSGITSRYVDLVLLLYFSISYFFSSILPHSASFSEIILPFLLKFSSSSFSFFPFYLFLILFFHIKQNINYCLKYFVLLLGEEVNPSEADIVGVDTDEDKAPFMVVFFRSSTEDIAPHIRKKRGSSSRRSRSRKSRRKTTDSDFASSSKRQTGMYRLRLVRLTDAARSSFWVRKWSCVLILGEKNNLLWVASTLK